MIASCPCLESPCSIDMSPLRIAACQVHAQLAGSDNVLHVIIDTCPFRETLLMWMETCCGLQHHVDSQRSAEGTHDMSFMSFLACGLITVVS